MTNSYYKEMIRLADSIADKAHEGQTDRNGWPYISHPRRVALEARKLVSDMAASTSPDTSLEELKAEAQIVALLHNTVEDTGVSLSYLARYFSPQIVDAIEALTRRPGESRVSYLGRVRANDLARLVKRADIMDNLDPDRLAKLEEPTRSCLHIKYEHSLELLGLGEEPFAECNKAARCVDTISTRRAASKLSVELVQVGDCVLRFFLGESFKRGSQLGTDCLGRHVHRLLVALCLLQCICVPVSLHVIHSVLSRLGAELLKITGELVVDTLLRHVHSTRVRFCLLQRRLVLGRYVIALLCLRFRRSGSRSCRGTGICRRRGISTYRCGRSARCRRINSRRR